MKGPDILGSAILAAPLGGLAMVGFMFLGIDHHVDQLAIDTGIDWSTYTDEGGKIHIVSDFISRPGTTLSMLGAFSFLAVVSFASRNSSRK